jgi:hypothetical protein
MGREDECCHSTTGHCHGRISEINEVSEKGTSPRFCAALSAISFRSNLEAPRIPVREYRAFLETSRNALASVESLFDVQMQAVIPLVHQSLQSLQRTIVISNQQVSQSIRQSLLDMEQRLHSSEVDANRLAAIFQSVTNCSSEIARVLQTPSQELVQQPSLSSNILAISAVELMPRYKLSRTISSVRELWQEWEMD